jgi:hypothetical protein
MTDLPSDPAALLWERWTIDELFDQVARVLVCRAEPLASHATLIETVRAGANDTRPDAEDVAAILRAAVAEAEIRGGESWSEEAWSFIDVSLLATFLERRTGKPGLPRNRPLREGDVFLVAVERDALGATPLSETGRAAREIGDTIAAYEAAGLEVFDVTAAARQSAKVLHDAALRATAREVARG